MGAKGELGGRGLRQEMREVLGLGTSVVIFFSFNKLRRCSLKLLV